MQSLQRTGPAFMDDDLNKYRPAPQVGLVDSHRFLDAYHSPVTGGTGLGLAAPLSRGGVVTAVPGGLHDWVIPAPVVVAPTLSTFASELAASGTRILSSGVAPAAPIMGGVALSSSIPTSSSSSSSAAPKKVFKYATKAATPCRFFNTPKGCQFGDKCAFGHFRDDEPDSPPPSFGRDRDRDRGDRGDRDRDRDRERRRR